MYKFSGKSGTDRESLTPSRIYLSGESQRAKASSVYAWKQRQ